jgi:predicted small lipoprotein YifL
MTVHKHLYWLLTLMLCAALSGCGQKGDLYLPDDRAGEQKQRY